jgi:hypothetical protein
LEQPAISNLLYHGSLHYAGSHVLAQIGLFDWHGPPFLGTEKAKGGGP